MYMMYNKFFQVGEGTILQETLSCWTVPPTTLRNETKTFKQLFYLNIYVLYNEYTALVYVDFFHLLCYLQDFLRTKFFFGKIFYYLDDLVQNIYIRNYTTYMAD